MAISNLQFNHYQDDDAEALGLDLQTIFMSRNSPYLYISFSEVPMKAFSNAILVCGTLSMLAACVGSDEGLLTGGSAPQPNSVVFSDVLLTGVGVSERVTNVYCRPDGSLCEATYHGQTHTFEPIGESDGGGTIFRTYGFWEYTRAGIGYELVDGIDARVAASGGVKYVNSLPRGSATWIGDLVGMDANNRVVRGNATIWLEDFGNPVVDVSLRPRGYAEMNWYNIPVTSGGFSERYASFDYIKGEFYGPHSEEVGGVFERNSILGAFGASR